MDDNTEPQQIELTSSDRHLQITLRDHELEGTYKIKGQVVLSWQAQITPDALPQVTSLLGELVGSIATDMDIPHNQIVPFTAIWLKWVIAINKEARPQEK